MNSIPYLFSDLSSFSNIIKKDLDLLKRIVPDSRVIDLLLHKPSKIIDRSLTLNIKEKKNKELITVVATPIEYNMPLTNYGKKSPYKIKCITDNNIPIVISFFNSNSGYLRKLLPIGIKKIISGNIYTQSDKLYISHPDKILPISALSNKEFQKEVVYPLTTGLTNYKLCNIIHSTLNYIPDIPEWIPKRTIQKNNWSSFKTTIHKLHAVKKPEDILSNSDAISRLAYDEMLAYQLVVKRLHKTTSQKPGIIIKGNKKLQDIILSKVGFELTAGQKKVIEEIQDDQNLPSVMIRLLQGDVGSGKTIVALLCMVNAIEAGYQATLITPTEILATQHFKWIESVCKDSGINIALLTGKTKTKDKKILIEKLAEGKINLLIGTHALLQHTVQFNNLAIAVIDEQHKFGVEQREILVNKGNGTDILLISATPIPRTLTLTIYGEISCSILKDKPKHKQAIHTSVMQIHKVLAVIKRIKESGAKAYWVCPLIEDNANTTITSVEERFKSLQEHFHEEIAMLHGKMDAITKENIINNFHSGQIKILLATTVIEVGIDNKDATIIVIEGIERFGLAQLHQLRGRVGRGSQKSYCILLYNKLTTNSKKRMQIMKETEDGFLIAEEDLKIRREGDLIGKKQSGIPDFKFIDIWEHKNIIKSASEQANEIINIDPTLTLPTHDSLKILLEIFNYHHKDTLTN